MGTLAPVLVALLILVPLCGLRVRPRMLGWGSTPEERRAPLPGDDLMPGATTITTRAVTMRAPASAVWPWVVQMGQDRAGFTFTKLALPTALHAEALRLIGLDVRM